MRVDLAIVGMGCALPGAPDLPSWLARGREGTSAIGPLPRERWPGPEAPRASGQLAPDALTTLQVGAIALPSTADEPVTALLDRVAREAVAQGARREGRRVDLVLANLALPSTAAVRAAAAPWAAAMAEAGIPARVVEGGRPIDRFQAGLPARVVARRLGFTGAAFGLDAACASGLYAVRLAADRLRRGQADLALAAGVQIADLAFLLLGFTQLKALSPSGLPRPFDARADGLIVGEGAAAVLLKRLDDAHRDGDTIHAVLRGGGHGNDGRSGNLLAPRAEGQLRTLRAAWADAGLAPEEVGYVECHATGTRLGDHTELDALARLLPAGAALASTKGAIGHTITVAGLAGLIRAVGAVRDGWIPGNPWCEQPKVPPGFRVPLRPEPWPNERRVAAVSAFGFGGTNAHWIVERAPVAAPPSSVRAPEPAPLRLAVVGVGARLGDERDPRRVAAARRGEVALKTTLSGVAVPALRWRLPPQEAKEVLPQQLLALEVAEAALTDAPALDPARVGVAMGMSIDLHVASHSLRPVNTAAAPPLTAARVQGVLPNFVANRVSARFGLEGPSAGLCAEALSAAAALSVAEGWLASRVVDAVLVGAVDLPALPGALAAAVAVDPERRRPAEGGVALVLRRLADAEAAGEPILAVLDAADLRTEPEGSPAGPRSAPWHAEAADFGFELLAAIATAADGGQEALAEGFDLFGGRARVRVLAPPARLARPLAPPRAPPRELPEAAPVWVPHPKPPGLPAYNAPFDGAHAPLPLTGAERAPWVDLPVPTDVVGPSIPWATRREQAPVAPTRASVHAPSPAASPPGSRPAALTVAVETAALARATARKQAAVAEAHAQFLRQRAGALTALAGQLTALERALADGAPVAPGAVPAAPSSAPARPEAMPAAPAPRTPWMDRAALERFAAGSLSSALGAAYADLDHVRPRVRLPLDPFLLVSRVVSVEGERGKLGRARIVTEYDLPPDAPWAHDGRPPPCVVVESGQADLLLVSILGIDALTEGRSLYRLLDCDLVFHGERPRTGTTLRHDIRIKSFARLGSIILFYFEYDGIDAADGRPVITMRNGCAGFFPPSELATPMGCDTAPSAPPPCDFQPRLQQAPATIDEAGLAALMRGDLCAALGPAYPARAALKLPPRPWGLLHRARDLAVRGGLHGLGGLVAEQDLADDDWFNAVHFLDDPCMPGTLMLDGCFQALQIWALAAGLGAQAGDDARFDPLPETATRLRCRGQVAPGHRKLAYEVRILAAGLDPDPWVRADVILHVDGTPVVRAEDVGLRVLGARPPHDLPGPAHFVEHAVGSHARAFGPQAARFDAGARGPRIPGLPLQLLSRVEGLSAQRGQLREGDEARVSFDLPPAHWLFQANAGAGFPVVGLMEAALQPCGWLTAWGGVALKSPGELFFRNLGGSLALSRPVVPGAGPLSTLARVSSTSASAGMTLTFFELSVSDAEGEVMRGDTHFGYFTPAALAGQRGLPTTDAHPRPERALDLPAAGAPGLPRDDLRMLDRVTFADSTGGSAGLGRYAAELDIDAAAWFFTAHFHEDPVMPGSLGVEGLAQLARWVLATEVPEARGRLTALLPGSTLRWKYRGQVLRAVRRVALVLDITERAADRLVCSGTLWADDLPIYRVDGLTVGALAAPAPACPGARLVPAWTPAPRPRPTAALLDAFEVRGDEGVGRLRLDPALHPWFADHCPTLTAPALPMAFAAEIAAEAALRLRPGLRVVGLPTLEASRWLHAGEGAFDLTIVAVAQGDTVAVSLARAGADGAPVVHMKAVVALAAAWPEPPPEPEPLVGLAPDARSAAAYYAEGHTFHGPTLAAMTDLGRIGPSGAEATLTVCADALALGLDELAFTLDPVLLDAATHPMRSATPEAWSAAIPKGKLAYPVRAEGLRFYGPRPAGAVTCRLDLVEANERRLSFDVRLSSEAGLWCAYRWIEAVVDGGLLGAGAEVVRRFLVDGEPIDAPLGEATPSGWRLPRKALVEPLPGTLAALLLTEAERAALGGHPDARRLSAILAAKQAIRAHLRAANAPDVHPRRLQLLELRPDLWVVQEAFDLPADRCTALLHPRALAVRVVADAQGAEATVVKGVGRSL